MKKDSLKTFQELCKERAENEENLNSLASALDDALANDSWSLIDELETMIRIQLEKMSMLLQSLRYLESN